MRKGQWFKKLTFVIRSKAASMNQQISLPSYPRWFFSFFFYISDLHQCMPTCFYFRWDFGNTSVVVRFTVKWLVLCIDVVSRLGGQIWLILIISILLLKMWVINFTQSKNPPYFFSDNSIISVNIQCPIAPWKICLKYISRYQQKKRRQKRFWLIQKYPQDQISCKVFSQDFLGASFFTLVHNT